MEHLNISTENSLVHAMLSDYNNTVLPALYPQWHNFYSRLSQNYDLNPFPVYAKVWTERMSSLILAADRRVFWNLSIPNLPEEERHQLLQAFQYVKNKGICLHAAFAQHEADALTYTTLFCRNKETKQVFKTHRSADFNFLIVDDAVLFEEPSLPHQQHRIFFLVKKADNATLEILLKAPRLSCPYNNLKEFIAR
jgi:hypothetical protein